MILRFISGKRPLEIECTVVSGTRLVTCENYLVILSVTLVERLLSYAIYPLTDGLAAQCQHV